MSQGSESSRQEPQKAPFGVVDGSPDTRIFRDLLDTLLAVTASQYGFIGEVRCEQDGTRFLRAHAISNLAWTAGMQEMLATNPSLGLDFFGLDTLLSAGLLTGEPVLSNDPAGDSRSRGLPAGHPPLDCFLALPLYDGDELVGLLGVANREGGYDQALVESLRPIQGVCAGLVVAFRGSERRREAESALRESELRFRQLAENIHEVFWLVDIHLQTVVYVSPAYETIWGRTVDELYGDARNWIEAIHPDHREAVAANFDAVDCGGKFDEEYIIQRPDGTERWIHDRGWPICDEDGKVLRIAGIAEDITDRKRLEESLHKSEARLRHSQRIEALGRVAGGVAHDFNNLLTVINGNTEALRRAIDDESQLQLLGQIDQAGQRAAGLTRQLLAFSRKQVLELRVLDMRDVVIGLQQLLPRLLGETVRLRVETGPDPLWIEADQHQLVQVVMNLAVNARDAMPGGGDIHIQTALEVAAGADGAAPGIVRLTVSDTGAGIPADVLPYIFDPFFTTKVEGKGSGLGLSMAYGIVTQLGGKVEVESVPDRGASFHVRLPAADRPGSAVESAAPAFVRCAAQRTVLLVEDERLVRAFVATSLADAGYEVLEVADAESALALLEDSGPHVDLLVTDVVLPGLSGVELARSLHARFPALQVLYVSGYTADYASEFGVTEGGHNFLQKPFTAAEMVARIEELLAGSSG